MRRIVSRLRAASAARSSMGVAALNGVDTSWMLATGTLDGLALHDLPFVDVHHGVQLTAARSTRDRGTRRSDAGNVFLWERTADGWQDAAEKLDVLIQCEQGHHYLDADDDQVVVEVSRGEYSYDWWHTHG